ncbi:hypothetical protein BH23THE1_BH23THE1_32710 [soil metagenome]
MALKYLIQNLTPFNLESFKDLQSFTNAKEGKLGSIVEAVDGKNMTISLAPVNFAQSK